MLIWGINRFNDGGPAAKELAPKLDLAKAHLSSRLGVTLPKIEVNVLVSCVYSLNVSGYYVRFSCGHSLYMSL